MPVQTTPRARSRAPMPRPAPPTPAPLPSARPASPDTLEVEGLLTDLLATYEELGSLAAAHRAAISRADGHGVEACARREAELADRLGALDARRQSLSALAGRPGERVTISRLIERLPQPARAAELVARLRDLVRKVQGDYATVRAATQAIVGHIDGLVQQVGQRLNGSGTYGREGRVDAARTVACGIDLTH